MRPDCPFPGFVGEVFLTALKLQPGWGMRALFAQGRWQKRPATAVTGGLRQPSPLEEFCFTLRRNVWGFVVVDPGLPAWSRGESCLAPNGWLHRIIPLVYDQNGRTSVSVGRFRVFVGEKTLPAAKVPPRHFMDPGGSLCSQICLNGLVTHQEKRPAEALFAKSAHRTRAHR